MKLLGRSGSLALALSLRPRMSVIVAARRAKVLRRPGCDNPQGPTPRVNLAGVQHRADANNMPHLNGVSIIVVIQGVRAIAPAINGGYQAAAEQFGQSEYGLVRLRGTLNETELSLRSWSCRLEIPRLELLRNLRYGDNKFKSSHLGAATISRGGES